MTSLAAPKVTLYRSLGDEWHLSREGETMSHANSDYAVYALIETSQMTDLEKSRSAIIAQVLTCRSDAMLARLADLLSITPTRAQDIDPGKPWRQP